MGDHKLRLSDAVLTGVKKRGVKVYFADRRITKIWNKNRMDGEPIIFGGWFWTLEKGGKVLQTDEEGPFRTRCAAIRDAWKVLQIR